MDDLSSLGGSIETGPQSIQNVGGDGGGGGGGGGGAWMGDDDGNKYELIVDGLKCPDEFVRIVTPMEFEEMVNMFKQFDINKRGTIDKFGARKILMELGMDSSAEKADEFMDIVDVDGSGEIDFDEYCRFIVLLKQGDERMNQFDKVLDQMKTTPLGELERQRELYNFKMEFLTIEVREATASSPPMFVVELRVTGTWYSVVDGIALGKYEMKAFQGIGKSTKDAKYQAATLASLKIRSMLPGVKYSVGEFPDDWREWIDHNLGRGVDPSEIVSVLTAKGFHPHRNIALMQRIITWKLLDIFLMNHPEFDLNESTRIDVHFQQWIKDVLIRGIDGQVVLQVLEDRNILLRHEHLHFAQKMARNEVGVIMESNEHGGVLLDFWTACERGYLEDVKIYCAALMPTNEEKISRHTSEIYSPLTLAAKNGHFQVVEVLIQNGADVKGIDRRGRTALHHAAGSGHLAACEVLIDKGAHLFANDFRGNTPLHLAAQNNRPKIVDYVAFKSKESTAAIIYDKIRCKKDVTFKQLVEIAFEKLQDQKLSLAEVRRFDKTWVHEGAECFRSLMDRNVAHMLAPTSTQIMDDVMTRFDPRPETGVFISNSITGALEFIPTVPGVHEFAIIISYMFQQSSIDPINAMRRTPLQLACEQNQINSHEEVVNLLIDKHGVNLYLQDMHNRRPIDILISDKNFPNAPSSTQYREESILNIREVDLMKFTVEYEEEQARIKTAKRKEILDDCTRRSWEYPLNLWDVTREVSILRRVIPPWEIYEDQDTLNFFYAKAPADVIFDKYKDYFWGIPQELKMSIQRTNALDYQIKIMSKLLRSIDRWEMRFCKRTNMTFYYDPNTGEMAFKIPKECRFQVLSRRATVVERLGFSSEWEVMVDTYNNTFYRNRKNTSYAWDKPLDAIKVTPADRYCTAYTHKKAIDQRVFICDACDRFWRNSDAGQKLPMLLCEACAFRCHRGHRGVRVVKEAVATCNCAAVCKSLARNCKACELSDRIAVIQQKLTETKYELVRKREMDALMPLCFTCVPPVWPDGKKKNLHGWMMVRCKPPSSLEVFGEDARLDFVAEDIDMDNESQASQELSVATETSQSILSSKTGSLIVGEAAPDKLVDALMSEDPPKLDTGLPPDWIECVDVEDTDDIPIWSRVLVMSIQGIVQKYATLIKKVKATVFRVKYDDTLEENIGRDRLFWISRPTFYANTKTGQSAWTKNQILNNPYDSCNFQVSGSEWLELYHYGSSRREFEEWEEVRNTLAGDLVFYVNRDIYDEELAVLKLQYVIRKKKRLPRPHCGWFSTAFTIDQPEKIKAIAKELGGWAYLRRRSLNIGEFKDIYMMVWEEYADRLTSEYFYFQPDSNEYSWNKPPAPDRTKKVVEYFKEGEEFLYLFQGRRVEDEVIITKVRFDDETGEDKYDIVHKYIEEIKAKWVPRLQLKKQTLGSEEMMLERLSRSWRQAIRRKRDKDERTKKFERDRRLAAELKRLEDEKKNRGTNTEATVADDDDMGAVAKSLRGRTKRSAAENREFSDEIDRTEGAARRQKVRDTIEQMKRESSVKLSRAEVLSLTRALDSKFQIEDKVIKRDKLKKILDEKKKKFEERTIKIDAFLRDKEAKMTTPRSLLRRKVIRRLHLAMRRQLDAYMICEWGCGDWIKVGSEQHDHQLNRCPKRILPCWLGCDLKKSEEDWLKPYVEQDTSVFDEIKEEEVQQLKLSIAPGTVSVQQHHEENECPKRVVACPRQCLEMVAYEVLKFHMDELCTKRPAKPIACRLGCDAMFGGTIEQLIEAEDERFLHETETCDMRIVRCNWKMDDGSNCAAQMMAKDRDEHKEYHIQLLGIQTFKVPGTYLYTVPKKVRNLKVQLWGGGGGSGFFKDRQQGNGGGGALVEAIITVSPYDVLEIVVGTGGQGGQTGTLIEDKDIERLRRETKEKRLRQTFMSREERIADNKQYDNRHGIEYESAGIALGGTPGGGIGYAGGTEWASGGGGGYSIIAKRTPRGNEAILVAAGGGGGGSLDGLPGGGLHGPLPGTRLDPRNGSCGTCEIGGEPGDSGSIFNSAWPATRGEMWQGGNGCEYGAGGGGGYYGGGGGGNTPGISGGGGGGSSYIHTSKATDYFIIIGDGHRPGGWKNHNPPEAVGLGEWDKQGGLAGTGGVGTVTSSHFGNNGAVRIIRPGHY